MTYLAKSQSMLDLTSSVSAENDLVKTGGVTTPRGTLASGYSIRTTQCSLSILWDKMCTLFGRCFPCINRNRKIKQVAPNNVDQQLAALRLKAENLEKVLKARDHYINRNLDRIFKVENTLEPLKLENHKHAVKLGEARAQSINIAPKNTASAPQRLAIINGVQIVTTQDDTMVAVNRPQSSGNDSVSALEPAPQQLAIEAGRSLLAITEGSQQLPGSPFKNLPDYDDASGVASDRGSASTPGEAGYAHSDDHGFTVDKLACELETFGSWNDTHGDIAPELLVESLNWPKDVCLKINSIPANGVGSTLYCSKNRRNYQAPPPDMKIVAIQLKGDHYSPIVDGTVGMVAGDGNCFFRSILAAMSDDQKSRLLGRSYESTGNEEATRINIMLLRTLCSEQLKQGDFFADVSTAVGSDSSRSSLEN